MPEHQSNPAYEPDPLFERALRVEELVESGYPNPALELELNDLIDALASSTSAGSNSRPHIEARLNEIEDGIDA